MREGIMWKGDTDLSSYFHVEKIHRPILAPQNLTTTELPGQAGGKVVRVKDDPYTLSVDIALLESDPTKYRQRLREVAPLLKEAEPLRFYDEPDVYVIGQLEGSTDFSKEKVRGEGTLNFYIADPYAYAWEKEEIIIARDEDPSLTIPTTFAQAYNGYIQRIGTAPTDLKLELTMQEDADQIRITHEESGKYLEMNGDFQAGDTVMIDMAKHYVEHNNENAMTKLSLRSRFFRLEVTNTLTFTPERGADIVATYTPKYY